MKIDWFDSENIFFTGESLEINWFNSEKYSFTDSSVKRQITDSISENLIDSDLESRIIRLYWVLAYFFGAHQFVNQSYPTKVVKIRAFFLFFNESRIAILVSDEAYKSLPTILITFFDWTKIRKVTVYWNLKKVYVMHWEENAIESKAFLFKSMYIMHSNQYTIELVKYLFVLVVYFY